MRLPDRERSRAILAGSAHYASKDLRDLHAVEENLLAMQRLLVDQRRSGFTEGTCAVVRDPHVQADVMARVQLAADEAEDVLLVYFAGHGLLLGRSQRELYLAVSSTVPGQPWTAVPYAQVADLVRHSVAAVKVVILDCCFSGRATAVPMSERSTPTQEVEIEGAYVLASSSATRESYSPENARHTAFTAALLTALYAADTPPDELLSMADVFLRVRRYLKAAGYPEPQQYSTNTAAHIALVRGGASPPADDVRTTGRNLAAETDKRSIWGHEDRARIQACIGLLCRALSKISAASDGIIGRPSLLSDCERTDRQGGSGFFKESELDQVAEDWLREGCNELRQCKQRLEDLLTPPDPPRLYLGEDTAIPIGWSEPSYVAHARELNRQERERYNDHLHFYESCQDDPAKRDRVQQIVEQVSAVLSDVERSCLSDSESP
jgi:hypothetical protein